VLPAWATIRRWLWQQGRTAHVDMGRLKGGLLTASLLCFVVEALLCALCLHSTALAGSLGDRSNHGEGNCCWPALQPDFHTHPPFHSALLQPWNRKSAAAL
jgi:hypothetical protein